MSSEGAILLVSGDAEVASEVTAVVEATGMLSVRHRCANLKELVAELNRASAAAAIIDLMTPAGEAGGPAQMFHELETIISEFPQTRFIVVGSELHSEWLLQAMQAGARHYMTRQTIAKELPRVLERIAQAWMLESGSAIVTILSSAGGCGATTLAVNLAHELQEASDKPTLLIDLDCCYGTAAEHMGLEGMYGLADVLSNGAHLDKELINTTVVRRHEKLHLLMSPASQNPAEPTWLDLTRLPRLLHVCRQAYGYVVVDAPRVPMDVAAELAKASLATLLTFQLNVTDLKAAKAMYMALLQRGVEREQVVPVACRYRKRYSLVSLNDAQRALGDVRPGLISNDYTSAQASLNYGKPLSQCAPRSALRKNIRSLASSLIEAHRGNQRLKEW